MLRHFISLVLVTFLISGFLLSDAQAKRFGGGKSFGMSRSISSPSRAQSMFAPKQGANRWLAPLAGLAMGGLLASLFMGNGLGTGILTWLMVAGVAFMLITFIRNLKQRNAMQRSTPSFYQNHAANQNFSSTSANVDSPFARSELPHGFDEHAFLRDAKAQFIRLQTAFDQANLNDLRDFTLPEVFAEIRLQLQERGNQLNQTDVISLNAQLLDLATESSIEVDASKQLQIASVQFSGMIREDNQVAAPFKEIWHFQKNIMGDRWAVAGIQQVQ